MEQQMSSKSHIKIQQKQELKNTWINYPALSKALSSCLGSSLARTIPDQKSRTVKINYSMCCNTNAWVKRHC
jgi:hypothetical protein